MPRPKLDKVDRKILAALQADGRMSNVELARQVGLSAPPCLRRVRTPIDGVLFDDDWLAPESSLRALMAKMPDAPARVHTLHHAALGTRADHFAWMKQPQAVVDALLS